VFFEWSISRRDRVNAKVMPQTDSDRTLTELILEASTRVFADWRATSPDERVFAFALSTLDAAIYVSGSLNADESH